MGWGGMEGKRMDWKGMDWNGDQNLGEKGEMVSNTDIP